MIKTPNYYTILVQMISRERESSIVMEVMTVPEKNKIREPKGWSQGAGLLRSFINGSHPGRFRMDNVDI